MRIWTSVLIVALLSVGLAGCVADSDSSKEEPTTPAPAKYSADDGTIHVEVPVDVLLIGFAPGMDEKLQRDLSPIEVHHDAINFARNFVTDDNANDAPTYSAVPIVPTAVFRVHQAPQELAEGYFSEAHRDENGLFNTTLMEAWLLENVESTGVALDENRQLLILTHDQGRFDGHQYRYFGNTGYYDGGRVYGEKEGFTVYDVSAAIDPYVGDRYSYSSPLGNDDVSPLVDLIADATELRLLQGAIYPVPITKCHAVTMILGIRQGATTSILPGYTKPEDVVGVEKLTNHLKNLTREDNVFVDFVMLDLPTDDPALDAISRESVQLDTFRYWLDENWENYWVPHEGCEPYVSFVLYGDAADEPVGFSGIAMYDVQRSHRISFSLVSDLTRLRGEWPGYHEEVDDIMGNHVEGRGEAYWFDRLFSHETGHLFGLPHPHNAIKESGSVSNRAMSAVWTTMSYQIRGVIDDFGYQDQINFLRNRAGYAHQAVVEAGLTDDPAYQAGLDALAQYQWQEAGDAWVELLAANSGTDSGTEQKNANLLGEVQA